MNLDSFKKEYIDTGLWTWLILIIPVCICLFSAISTNKNTGSTATPEPGYTGKCTHWSDANSKIGQVTCMWGFPTSTATGSWVWLHFSERSYPFPDFAADIDNYIGGDVKFTANNLAKIYIGHCVEVYGKVQLESNKYNGKKVDQPLIHVNSVDDIKFCDNKFKKE